MKIKIGENEYQPPFRAVLISTSNPDIPSGDITVWGIEDANGKSISVEGFYFSEEDASTVLSSLNELAQLRADRDALKARVEELENTIDCGCNALTDSICCSGNDADTNLGFVRKMKRVLIGNNPTTPGGDE